MKQYLRLLIVLIVLFGIIASFALYLSWPILTGKTIVLATTPVDPFDVFRGQYITIAYEISSVPLIAGAEMGDGVYVALNEDENGIWRYSKASLNKPSRGDFIRGDVKYIRGDKMILEYGIEQFFFERDARIGVRNMTVEVRVSDSGQARISELLQDGEVLEINYK